MSDPIPSATADPEVTEQPLRTNAEDRKAAAALNALNTNELAADAAPSKGPSSADQEALGKAMSRLEIAAGQGSAKKSATETQKKEAEVKKKAVKIAAADVSLLVSGRVRNRLFLGSEWTLTLEYRLSSWICIRTRRRSC